MDRTQWLVRNASIALIVAGAVFLALNLFLSINITLPLVFMLLGTVFYLLVNAFSPTWPWAPVFYIPGTLLMAFGIVFLLNVITNDWNSWAYAWLLLVAGIGLGVALSSRKIGWRREIALAGAGSAALSVTLFALFGAIAGGPFIMIMAPVLVVLGGVALRFVRPELYLPERFRSPAPAAGLPATPDQAGLVEPLSARELEVLRLIDQGLSNPAIAEKLTLAHSTVKTHINNLYGKLGVETRTQALKRARELGLLQE